MPANVEIRRAADRAVTTTSWLKSRHSFSFGDHYDPGNTHHGLLLVNNDDSVEPASGFDTAIQNFCAPFSAMNFFRRRSFFENSSCRKMFLC